MMGLTKRQSECLAFVRSYVAEKGQPPSYMEIAGHFGLRSKSGAHRMLQALQERGAIRMIPRKVRSLEIIEADSVALSPEISRLVRSYAEHEGIKTDTAVNELLREVLGAAA